MNKRKAVCMAAGARQFWLVDPGLQTVEVNSPSGSTLILRPGEEIDLAEFGGSKLSVAEVFAE